MKNFEIVLVGIIGIAILYFVWNIYTATSKNNSAENTPSTDNFAVADWLSNNYF